MERQQKMDQPTRVHQIKRSFKTEEQQQKTAQPVSQNSLLLSAVMEGNEKVVKFLLKHGADPNSRMRSGKEPIQTLSTDPNPEVREIFYRYRAASINSTGFSSLTLSAGTAYTLNPYTGHRKRSISSVSEKFLPRDRKNPTAVHVAAANGYRDILKLLIEYGGDVNLEVEGDYTALSIAILCRHYDVAELLIEHGANVNYRGKSGKTPLYFAVKSRQTEMVLLLLSIGANVNDRTQHGVTPLHIAVERKLYDVTELLLKNGSDVNAKTRTGVTPLHCAAVKGQKEITELILSYGGDVSLIMKKGEIDVTPLLWVTESERKKITEILSKYVVKSNTCGYYTRLFKKVWKHISGKKSISN